MSVLPNHTLPQFTLWCKLITKLFWVLSFEGSWHLPQKTKPGGFKDLIPFHPRATHKIKGSWLWNLNCSDASHIPLFTASHIKSRVFRSKYGYVCNSHSLTISWENVFSIASYHCFPYCLIHSINHLNIHKIFSELLLCDRECSRYRDYVRNKGDKNSCPHGAYYTKGEMINTLACYILLLMVIIGMKKNKVEEGSGG